ncbi:MAG: DNA polymerase III subunit gamma/tau [Clostridia bacterium]
MSYKALYRKYRPKSFDEVIGQQHITTTLKHQIQSGEIGHAYLFCGSRGTGKTSVAKIFAKALNCKNPIDGSPCGKCEVCLSLEQESNMDVLEIDAASNNRVDEIRNLRENVKFMPVVASKKVYIIDEVHMLTDSAFNALLKTLEEPPNHVVFVLATTEPHKLPATILSRCMRFDFALIGITTLVKHLKRVFETEKIAFEEDALKLIAGSAEGSVRDCLSIADCVVAFSNNNVTVKAVTSVLGTVDKENLIAFTQTIIDKNIGLGLEIIEKVCSSGKNVAMFAKNMTIHFRNLLVVKTCEKPNDILLLPAELLTKYFLQAESLQSDKLIFFMKTFSAIESELKYALSPRSLVEIAFLSCISGDDCQKKK